MKIETDSLEKTHIIGSELGKRLFPGMIMTLTGDLGAGKTTLTKSIAKGLGVKEIVNSPTFTIFKIYESGRLPLYHFDAYRLEDGYEDLGFEEYLDSDGVSIVEWAMYMEDILPQERLELVIDYIDETKRCIHFHPVGEKYEQLCKELEQCLQF